MDLKLSYCTLAVHDHDKALAFYRDVLGSAVHHHHHPEALNANGSSARMLGSSGVKNTNE
ncbi:MAG: VOC family protein [Micromonosporaceae bacterium]